MNDDADEYYATKINFNFTIMAIFAWLVPAVGIEMGNYRTALRNSPNWKREAKLELGLSAVHKAGGLAILAALVAIIDMAVLIALLTQDLDNRMYSVLQGLSRLFGALVIYVISIMSPKWFGVYYYKANTYMATVGNSTKVVRFNVSWGVLRQFGRCGFFLLPFFCGVNAITLPVSILAGLVAGFAVDACVFLSRRRNEKERTYIAAVTAVAIALCSAVLFSDGVWYIAVVWGTSNEAKRTILTTAACGSWALAGILVHVILYINAKRNFAQLDTNKQEGSIRPGLDTAVSMIFDDKLRLSQREGAKDKPEGNENNGQEQTQNDDGDIMEPSTEVKLEAPEEIEYDGDAESTICDLLKSKVSCCGCIRGNDKSSARKTANCCVWLVWFSLVFFSLWIVVVNIGATKEGDETQKMLPSVYEEVYRYMDEGPVCAFDNKGADSNITTFPDKDAAHDAGFFILHCGACGACSDWHNLSREYLTRDFLASESSRCARKSLFLGGSEDVTKCLNKEPILFLGECAECWTTDILCTKGNCTFIFLQSTMINRVGDFTVGPNTVTSAACEEAFCEAGQFVPCSGATRRRMNVSSTIARPGAQRCSIVDVVWEDLFPEDE